MENNTISEFGPQQNFDHLATLVHCPLSFYWKEDKKVSETLHNTWGPSLALPKCQTTCLTSVTLSCLVSLSSDQIPQSNLLCSFTPTVKIAKLFRRIRFYSCEIFVQFFMCLGPTFAIWVFFHIVIRCILVHSLRKRDWFLKSLSFKLSL